MWVTRQWWFFLFAHSDWLAASSLGSMEEYTYEDWLFLALLRLCFFVCVKPNIYILTCLFAVGVFMLNWSCCVWLKIYDDDERLMMLALEEFSGAVSAPSCWCGIWDLGFGVS